MPLSSVLEIGALDFETHMLLTLVPRGNFWYTKLNTCIPYNTRVYLTHLSAKTKQKNMQVTLSSVLKIGAMDSETKVHVH